MDLNDVRSGRIETRGIAPDGPLLFKNAYQPADSAGKISQRGDLDSSSKDRESKIRVNSEALFRDSWGRVVADSLRSEQVPL